MTITQFEYIVALDTYRHFAKASKKCFITQPTLSMQIQKLEDELGVKIFDRSKQPVVPTEIGKLIIQQARIILHETQKIKELIEAEKEETAGELKLGIIPTLAPYLLPLFLTHFLDKYPQVQLQIEELQSEEIIIGLRNETLDAALLVTPLKEQGIVEMPLFKEEFVAYVGIDHPLISKKVLSVKDVSADDMWLLNKGHCFRNQMINICGEQKNKALNQFQFESGSMETLKKLVDKRSGYTLLPELAILDEPVSKHKQIKHFTAPQPMREVSLVVHRSFLKRKLIEALKSEILITLPKKFKSKRSGEIITWR